MLQPGDVLKDTYLVECLHATGGMAYVYKVEHIALGVKRALKVLQPQYSRDEECVARFRKEAQIMAQLRHPNIAEVNDCGVTGDGLVFLVMEWLEGEDLSQLMRREPKQTLPFILNLCQEVGAALAASHKVGVVHRDLKPGNIFLVRSNNASMTNLSGLTVKVVDFGIARLLNSELPRADLTLPGQMLGTPGYMAPEQLIEALGPVGPASDQFALAVIAYELLTGQRLYVAEGQDVGALYAMAQRMMGGTLPELSFEAEQHVGVALRRALHHQPAERFPSVDEFARALTERDLTTEPRVTESVTTPWPFAGQSPAASRRQKWRRHWSGGLIAISMLGLLLLSWHGKKPTGDKLHGALLSSPNLVSLIARQYQFPRRHIPAVPPEPTPQVPSEPSIRPCPAALDVSLRDDHLIGANPTPADRSRKARILQCIDNLRLRSLIVSRAEVTLLRSGSLLVASPFPRGPTSLFEHCLEHRLAGTTLPKEVHIKAVRDVKACGIGK